jgi:hypothetical protein
MKAVLSAIVTLSATLAMAGANNPPTPNPNNPPPPAPNTAVLRLLIVTDRSGSMAYDHTPANAAKFANGLAALTVPWTATVVNAQGRVLPIVNAAGETVSSLSNVDADAATRVANAVVNVRLGEQARQTGFGAPFSDSVVELGLSSAIAGLKSISALPATAVEPTHFAIVYWSDEDLQDAPRSTELAQLAQTSLRSARYAPFVIAVPVGDQACYKAQSWGFGRPEARTDYANLWTEYVAQYGTTVESLCAADYSNTFSAIQAFTAK